MSAAVLTFVSDVCCGLEATGNWAAAADAALWLVLGYDYNGYGMMNIHYEHAVLQSSTPTDRYARTMRLLALLVHVCSVFIWFRRPSGRVSECSRAIGA